ncbi:transporter substrate-binding domain-containing protein [Leifsonia shinshuensis]|uniref:Polar amino acid transport system substrate-binding protein n=1 Tax=Leifsonia shinshuensis TaxID=150026 RepID=A0A853CPN8_9MICO|nr:transporter substrate-binding domain-containing protein [Leifsonia shinshuensis]NYJ22279.1 polar amino acid transport system substrate-binding protein [Leifsonia shinshuensis]
MSPHITPPRRRLGVAGAVLASAALVVSLAACSGQASAENDGSSNGGVAIAAHTNGVGTPTTIQVTTVAKIADELPAAVKSSGKLVIGVGALPAGFPPLAFTGDDQKTLTGSEPDLGRLVAAVLGLKPEVKNATWDNLFVGIDTGATDVGFSNITDTEQRKEKYDFASYRKDELAFTVLKKNTWEFNGDYENLAGKTIAVSSGTNQEKILLEWKTKLEGEGKTLNVKYYPDTNSTILALNSGKIDASFGPNPGAAYQNTQSASSANPTRTAGTYSGAGASLQGLIAATVKKGSGLDKPIADAINYLIDNGQYAKWLKAYNLTNEGLPKSEINPPGLPISNQ